MFARIRAHGENMSKRFGQIDFKEIWTIPNLITYFRILCVPAFVALMAVGGVRGDIKLFYAAFGVFVVAAASDLLDGFIARKFNMQSGIGMALDPVADKLMHISVLFCLSLCTGLTKLGADQLGKEFIAGSGVTMTNPWFVHWAFVVLIVAKEIVQALIALYVLKKGATVKANWLGKVSSFTISVGVILAFFHQYVAYADWGILAWGVVMSYAAAVNYLVDVVKQVKRISAGEMAAASAESVKEEDQRIVRQKKDGTYGE